LSGAVEISRYRFGEIEIDGHVYTADVIITPERVIDAWWRQHGHSLSVADLAAVLAARPDMLLAGTGYYGRLASAWILCSSCRGGRTPLGWPTGCNCARSGSRRSPARNAAMSWRRPARASRSTGKCG
jgi:hypothetical protein